MDRAPLLRRLALYEDECHRLLVISHRRAAAEEAEVNGPNRAEGGAGDNRRPVMPASTTAHRRHPESGDVNDGNHGTAHRPWTDSSDVGGDEVDVEEDGENSMRGKDDDDGGESSSSESTSSGSTTSGGEEEEEQEQEYEEDRDSEEDGGTLLATVSEDGEPSGVLSSPLSDVGEGGKYTNPEAASSRNGQPTKKMRPPSGKEQKRQLQAVQQHSSNLARLDLALDDERDDTRKNRLSLLPAAALLPGADLRRSTVASQALALLALSEAIRCPRGYVVVLLLRSGRFAGGIFEASTCVTHRALQRYTVRRGQGKAQSAQDQKSRAKSVGSQLRRAGEIALREDVRGTLVGWRGYIADAGLVFVACPKTMQSTLFFTDATDEARGPVLSKDDDRIRKVPFDAGRPTFESVRIVHEVMLGVEVREVAADDLHPPPPQNDPNAVDADPTPPIGPVGDGKVAQRERDQEEDESQRLVIDRPLTPLHEASKGANVVVLLDLLRREGQGGMDGEGGDGDLNRPAGFDGKTPLHFAAASASCADPSAAATCVSALLVQAHADPTLLDARGRPPYFLATHDRVREAFRRARAVLGEEHCDWDGGAKVGPPLTDDDVAARREREAEKKKRKKVRQREKGAKDEAHTREMEERRKVEEEKQRQAEEAKRVRDGLSAKPTGGNVCDYCQKKCVGKKRQQMFLRLDYKYCSTECVNAHKRELMAAAALSRLGGN